jgi:hypothetical protein
MTGAKLLLLIEVMPGGGGDANHEDAHRDVPVLDGKPDKEQHREDRPAPSKAARVFLDVPVVDDDGLRVHGVSQASN